MNLPRKRLFLAVLTIVALVGTTFTAACQPQATPTPTTAAPTAAPTEAAEEPAAAPQEEEAPAAEPAEGDKGLVFYLAPVLSDEFQAGSQQFVERYGREQGYTVKSLNANNNANLQISQMEDAMGQKPVAIIINAVDANMIASTVDRARDEGIIVEAYDRLIPTTVVDLSATAEMTEIGRTAARESLKLLKNKYGEEKGLVLEVVGDPGDYNAVFMHDGFMEIMGTSPNVEVISRDAQGWEQTVAASIIDDQLTTRGEEIDVLFAHCDCWMPAIAPVLQSHGYTPGDPRLMIIGQGGTPTGLESIREGWLQVSVDYPMSPEYKGMFDFLPRLLAGEKLQEGPYLVDGFENQIRMEDVGPVIRIPAEVITKEGGDGALNVDDPTLWGNVELPD